jgi:hypothetical protein
MKTPNISFFFSSLLISPSCPCSPPLPPPLLPPPLPFPLLLHSVFLLLLLLPFLLLFFFFLLLLFSPSLFTPSPFSPPSILCFSPPSCSSSFYTLSFSMLFSPIPIFLLTFLVLLLHSVSSTSLSFHPIAPYCFYSSPSLFPFLPPPPPCHFCHIFCLL